MAMNKSQRSMAVAMIALVLLAALILWFHDKVPPTSYPGVINPQPGGPGLILPSYGGVPSNYGIMPPMYGTNPTAGGGTGGCCG